MKGSEKGRERVAL